MTFLVPCSYLQFVTLQEQNKASQIFQTSPKIISGCQSASHMLFSPDDGISSLVEGIFLMLVKVFTS